LAGDDEAAGISLDSAPTRHDKQSLLKIVLDRACELTSQQIVIKEIVKEEFLLEEKKEEDTGEFPLFDELLLEVFVHLDLKTLVSCSVVCKKWHLYTNLESVWRNKTTRWFENYVNRKKFAQAHIAPCMEDVHALALQTSNMWKSYMFFLDKELQRYCFQKVKASARHLSQGKDELSFEEGDILFVLQKTKGSEWWLAFDKDNNLGLIPSNHFSDEK